MTSLEIARSLAGLNQTEDALKAYSLAVHQEEGPEEKLEAALYILQNNGDYRISYTTFLELYRQGFCREDMLSLVTQAFYEPNAQLLKNRYERNCKRLEQYPYLFRKDFPDFEDLPIRFFPYDDHHGYLPFHVAEGRFEEFVNVRDTIISRNFFRDLEKPILAKDVFSQYELEYLNDNVRRSEDVGRENHVYLHYTNWETFCAWLQVLNVKPFLENDKVVFLIEDELSQYPIDFKERFGIDYSQFPVRPVALSEYNRLIWHTQLSSHNGGDFFNEIFDAHPNLVALPSVMLSSVGEVVEKLKSDLKKAGNLQNAIKMFVDWNPRLVAELYSMRDPSDKDYFVAIYLNQRGGTTHTDKAARIVPALFFQPHFHNIIYNLHVDRAGRAVLHSEEHDNVRSSPIFQGFKYIKTFTPMRRPTTSHGASMRFMYKSATEQEDGKSLLMRNVVIDRVLNRSFMLDPEDRLYHDSILVRFEDGKLNPKATFTALAAFLDLPYTESLTYCSEDGKTDPTQTVYGIKNAVGFDTATVYRTYDEYVNDSERKYIEYFMRDVYAFYGYDFHYYDGEEMDKEKIMGLIEDFTTLDRYVRETWKNVYSTVEVQRNGQEASQEETEWIRQEMLEKRLKEYHENRVEVTNILMRGLRFVNENGQPLQMMPKLQLDPDLLEQPLYH